MKLGYCYIVQRGDGAVKIGFTTDMKNRRRLLEKDHGPLKVLRVLNGDRGREGELHKRFKSNAIGGEWFVPDAAMIEAIEALECGFAAQSRRETVWQGRKKEDAAATAEVWDMAQKLVDICYHNSGQDMAEAYKRAEREHGIGQRQLRRLANREAREPSYALMVRLRKAFKAECEARLAYLNKLFDLEQSITKPEEQFEDVFAEVAIVQDLLKRGPSAVH